MSFIILNYNRKEEKKTQLHVFYMLGLRSLHKHIWKRMQLGSQNSD